MVAHVASEGTPKEIKPKGFAKADPSKPLVPGHRDEKLVEPHKVLQEKIDAVLADVDNMNNGFGSICNELLGKYRGMAERMNIAALNIEAQGRLLKGILGEGYKEKFNDTIRQIQLEKRETDELAFNKQQGVEDVTDAAQKADMIVADFVWKKEGQPIKFGFMDYAPFQIDGFEFVPGLNKHLVGMVAGDTKIFDFTVPDTFEDKSVAGNTYSVEVKAHKVKRIVKKDGQDVGQD